MIETDAPYMGFSGCRQNYLTKHDEYAASLNSKRRKRLQNSIYPNVPSSLPIVLDQVVKLLNEGRMERGRRVVGTRASGSNHDGECHWFLWVRGCRAVTYSKVAIVYRVI